MGWAVVPIPILVVVTLVLASPPGLPPSRCRIPGSCCCVWHLFPHAIELGMLVMWCDIVDVSFDVVGGGRGAGDGGQRGMWGCGDMVKGSGWCEQ